MNFAFVNLTPDTIAIHNTDMEHVVDVPPSGEIARCNISMTGSGTLPHAAGDIPTYVAQYGDVTGLPAPVAGVTYIVSGTVEAACTDREDVYAPGELLRDENGKPRGCIGLKQT